MCFILGQSEGFAALDLRYNRNMDGQWIRMATYNSESEALVVESFLKAHGIDVELFDTYANSYMPSISSAGTGMRLMVRSEDAERATQLLQERERASHLRLADEEDTPPRQPTSNFSNDWGRSYFRCDRVLLDQPTSLASTRFDFDLHFGNQMNRHFLLNLAHLEFVTTVRAL